ncbi:precorrin-8X methylmutase [Faecalicatena contorta]|uniref:precorrin-8X methylmutase n=1 Tax=Faecalicatena contorta TaxID=39482 RepID=UPI00196078A9|nr:precorrin-8X methylmutase [Faecalicatena contorta]MBM6686672.1 precorrin-8X methylmutase [Faecalicatena contorta]MBM6710864.1 precorrin-8X methylmutase [Faecalicatena contorta]
MTEKLEQVLPGDIEKRSFEIITQELGDRTFDPLEEPVIKRCIHTSADFDYADNLVFSPGAVSEALTALRSGALIVTDTNMGKAGINKKALASFGGEALCFMADPDVAESARREGTTRAVASMKKAAALARETERPLILAVGNAPTALVEICSLMDEGELSPALVIGVPVGFVNVVAAKEMLLERTVPSIVARGRKGGSNIAAAICNALLYMA